MDKIKNKKSSKSHPNQTKKAKKVHTDKLLDEALEETFPASDAVAKY
ncbi:Uncharacterised protein (plasmid) [Legionella adelaidensis]|uniref:Uncharacterized protein n=1 Tax=Legionella adelaidensis TaxID=45056 RepID=A0A448NAL0_9GAMM|nr:hypothetical protein [Legionella adelaidensis]VEH84915.1 Uncharacterised protein [Legionella adelaidensis]